MVFLLRDELFGSRLHWHKCVGLGFHCTEGKKQEEMMRNEYTHTKNKNREYTTTPSTLYTCPRTSRNAINSLQFGQKVFFGRKLFFFPRPILVRRQASNDLEIMTATAYDTLHRLDAIDRLDVGQNLGQFGLGRNETSLVIVFAPLCTPFAGNGIKFDSFGNGSHGSNKGRKKDEYRV